MKSVNYLLAATMLVAGSVLSSAGAGETAKKITWENLDDFACGNYHELTGEIRGIVIQHPWLYQGDLELLCVHHERLSSGSARRPMPAG